ncbi:glycerophosphocholine phosphodiesterase GPCPD1 [Daubentonia madagascariensis]|uniref:Glycerophosphocholine phosphodiesterase GPCPD1 n=1 Tax=Daubentonia madagascariensis TaxID=31869 RepID=A0ABD2DBI6_DAUMA
MTPSQVTFEIRGTLLPGEVFAICGSCDALGNWSPQNAVALLPENETGESMLWKATIVLSRGVSVQYRYFKGYFLEPKTIGGPCQVIVHKWETHLQPRSITPLENEIIIDDGQFGIHNGVETLDSGWLTCQTEIRLRLHYSEKPPVSITKKKFKKSRFRLAKVQENTIASLRNAASHGAAFVEFDVHLSKDFVPVVYHDLTCCLTMKKKFDADPVELFEIPVKELTFDQLQLLKLAHVTALKSKDRKESVVEEENSFSENQPFPSLKMVLESLPEDVGFNIEIKWICQQRDGIWDGNLSTYFDMNLFLDIILKTVLENSGKRRIVFSSFDADICTMVRQKQNKYPILFLTQGKSDIYPELMDLRSRTTPIAMSFAQFENLLGINAHTEDLLRNPSYIQEAKAKGLVIFCWGDDTNDPDNRRKLKEFGVNGLIYDRIYDWMPEQPNIFQVEQLERLKQELPELKSCLCPTVSRFIPSSLCGEPDIHVDANGIDNVENA